MKERVAIEHQPEREDISWKFFSERK